MYVFIDLRVRNRYRKLALEEVIVDSTLKCADHLSGAYLIAMMQNSAS